MSYQTVVKPRFLVPAVLAIVAVVVFTTVPFFRSILPNLWGGQSEPLPKLIRAEEGSAEIIPDPNDKEGGYPIGIRLSDEAVKGLRPTPLLVKPAMPRALPPQFGQVNYDLERLLIINALFPGQVASFGRDEIGKEFDKDGRQYRPLRVNDKVKQGQVLAVVYSVALGQAKSALVDAISAKKLSLANFNNQQEAYYKAALSQASLLLAERQLRGDQTTFQAAMRTLYTYKLKPAEMMELQKEADSLLEKVAEKAKRKPRNDEEARKFAADDAAEQEEAAKKWATVSVVVPTIKPDEPDLELTIVEKNVNKDQNIDPINSPPMFKLTDMRNLDVWVNAHEEYYPLLHEKMKQGSLKWNVMFKAYPDDNPLDLKITKVNPSIDPGLRTCLVTGALPNPEGKYLVGQFITASIDVDPEKDTVEIPTNALNDADGESLVFVQDAKEKRKFYLKRVSVVNRFKDYTTVRSKLSERDLQINKAITDEDIRAGKRRFETLSAGDMVATRGVVEMKAAFDQLSAKYRVESLRGK